MPGQRTVLTIGNFDGVHVGHASLLARAREAATDSGRVIALAFFPHPLTTLDPGAAPPILTTFEERARLLRHAGADEVVQLQPSASFLALSAEEFVATIVERYAPAAIVEGADFRFGAGRAGDMAALAELGRRFGFQTMTVPARTATLSDCTLVDASSTLIRWLLTHGRIADAAAALGRPYAMNGGVVQGDRRGRLLNMRTANLESPCLPPGDGVYAGVADLGAGGRWNAAISVGTNPTFHGRQVRVEAHLLDWPGPGPHESEYGWTMRLEFHHWLRDQIRFDAVEPLVRQMHEDVVRAGSMLRAGALQGAHA